MDELLPLLNKAKESDVVEDMGDVESADPRKLEEMLGKHPAAEYFSEWTQSGLTGLRVRLATVRNICIGRMKQN